MSFENFTKDSFKFLNSDNNQYISFDNLELFDMKKYENSSVLFFEAKKN